MCESAKDDWQIGESVYDVPGLDIGLYTTKRHLSPTIVSLSINMAKTVDPFRAGQITCCRST